MAAPKKAPGTQRDAYVKIHLTRNERRRINELALERNMPASTLCLMALNATLLGKS